MKSTLWWLGLIFGTLSVVMLLREAFEYGIAAPVEVVLGFYRLVVERTLGWADPLLHDFADWVSSKIGLRLILSEHWKHLFIALSAMFGGVARTMLRTGNDAWVVIVTSCIGAALFSLLSLSGDLPQHGSQVLAAVFVLMPFLFFLALILMMTAMLLVSTFNREAVTIGEIVPVLKGFWGLVEVQVAVIAFLLLNAGLKLAGIG